MYPSSTLSDTRAFSSSAGPSGGNVPMWPSQTILPTILAPPISSTNIASVYPQGSNDFLKDIAANLVRKLDDYLTSNVKRFNLLKDAIPLVKRAVELYMAQEYNQSITQNFQVYLFITALRASTPKLPPL